MKNRKREIRTSGSVRDEDGQHPHLLGRRKFLHLAAGAAALSAVSRIARAQTYPTRPVRIIVAAAAGGSTSFAAHVVGQWLSERLGHPFIVENRPGAGGIIGNEALVRAPADGYTLLMATVSSAINATLYATLYEKLNFNFIRDIAPVAGVFRGPYAMVVNPVGSRQVGSRVHRLRQGQSPQTQHGVGGHRHRVPCGGRVVQDDGRRRFGPRALSWWRAGAQ